ncbi:MAG: PhoH family protein [Clostridiales bacterium]
MKKTFVLDTNVLLQTPLAINSFGENSVVIPEVVLEELDKFKKENNELGANARHAGRIIDQLRKKGNLSEGISLDNGGELRVEMNYNNVELPESWDRNNNDNRILKVCKGLMKDGEKVFLVTKDVFERIKADVIGVIAQDFFAEQVPEYDDQYKGRIDVYVTEEKLNEFYEKGKIKVADIFSYSEDYKKNLAEVVNNEFIIIHSYNNKKQTALGKIDGFEVKSLRYLNERPFGVIPRNSGQKFIQEALMLDADRAPLVIIKGPAGTAKTFYSLAVGLHKIMIEQSKNYRKILVCRPNVHLDEEIGYLPGSEQEKIAPFLRPVVDNLEILIDNDEIERYKSEKELKDKIDELFDRKIITTEAIAFIRGRSIVKQWVVIDEAQNLTPRQVKGIITRAGIGTKIILIGDPEQIDQPFLDTRTNGLCYAAEKMKGSKLCFQLTLNEDECERSDLAYESSKRM